MTEIRIEEKFCFFNRFETYDFESIIQNQMNSAEINVLEEVELDNPIFIEALPGLGHVGKLAANHMIDELGATKFAEIYSPTFSSTSNCKG